jgi:hypothetical protein
MTAAVTITRKAIIQMRGSFVDRQLVGVLLNEPQGPCGEDAAGHQAESNRRQLLREHLLNDCAARGAQGHPDAHLARPASHGHRHEAENPGTRAAKSGGAQRREQPCLKVPPLNGGAERLGHGLGARDSHAWEPCLDHRDDLREPPRSLGSDGDDNIDEPRLLGDRGVDLPCRVGVESVVSRVADNADRDPWTMKIARSIIVTATVYDGVKR